MALAAAAFAAGCGSSSNDSDTTSASTGDTGTAASPTTASTAAAGSDEKAKIAFMYYTDADFPQAEKRGAERVADSVGYFVANFDPQKQNQQCLDAIQSGRFNAIMLGAIDPASGVPCVTAAKAAGIPVVTMDIPVGKDVNSATPQTDGVVGSVVFPIRSNGEHVAELVKQACEGKDPCNVIVTIATPNDQLTNSPIAAIERNVPNAKIVQKVVTGYDPSGPTKVLPDALTAHPDTNVIVLTADNLAGATLNVLKDAGMEGKVALIGNGGSKEGAKRVAAGDMFGTVAIWPEQMGEAAAQMLTDALNGRSIAEPGIDAFTMDQPQPVTKDTVDRFQAEWSG